MRATTPEASLPTTGPNRRGAAHEDQADVPVLIGLVRGEIVALIGGIYVLAVAIIVVVFSIAPGLDRVAAFVGVGVAGIAATAIAMALMDRALTRLDLLGRISLDLASLYDRARLDSLSDGLTGLGNYRAFQLELDRAAEMAQRHGQLTALLLLDIDDLKRTNDLEGHAAGDEVLRAAARAAVTNLRRIDRAFRIGGDEFAILCPQTTNDGAVTLGRRILAACLDGNRQPGGTVISVTIGTSAMPAPSADPVLLYRHADAALYWGKRHGRTDVQGYDPALHGVADDDRPAEEIATAIDQVIANQLLTPAYQPVFDIATGACIGYEGLIRPRADTGFRNVSVMFAAAETVMRTVELDLAAVRALASGADRLASDRYLAINLSPRTLEAAAFNPYEVLAVLAGARIEPERLVIELTEREAIEDPDQLARHLAAFRRSGARIAADDVGAGNAGLHLLSQFEFDIFKIDLSLVQSGTFLAPSRSVIRAIMDIAERLHASTIAEGIETPLQLEMVRQLGVNGGQGFLLGVPQASPDGDGIDVDALLASLEPEAGSDAQVVRAA